MKDPVPFRRVREYVEHRKVMSDSVSATGVVVVASAAEVAVIHGTSLEWECITTPTLACISESGEVVASRSACSDTLSSCVVFITVLHARKLSSRSLILIAANVAMLSRAIVQQRPNLRSSSRTSEGQYYCTLVAVGVDPPGSGVHLVRSVDLALGGCTKDCSIGGLTRCNLSAFCKINAIRCFDETSNAKWRLGNSQTQWRGSV